MNGEYYNNNNHEDNDDNSRNENFVRLLYAAIKLEEENKELRREVDRLKNKKDKWS